MGVAITIPYFAVQSPIPSLFNLHGKAHSQTFKYPNLAPMGAWMAKYGMYIYQMLHL